MQPSASAPLAVAPAGYRVDDLIIDVRRLRVRRADTEIALPGLSLELLLALTAAAPNVLSFDQLMERVWPGLVVSPETVSQRVKLVRDALGDDPHSPRYIAGVRGRGYRMAAAVTVLSGEDLEPAAPLPTSPVSDATEKPAEIQPQRRRYAAAAIVVTAVVFLTVGAVAIHTLNARRAAKGSAHPESSVVVQPPKSIAVLPLIDISPGGANEYLGDGLAQELSSRLARIPGLRVASRTSAFAFKGRNADVRTIAQTLGVTQILEGSVRRDGEHLRVTAQLIDAQSGYHLWSQSYDRTWRDLLTIEDELARAIIDALQVVLSGDIAQRFNHPPTTHVEAFDLYLGGLARLRQPMNRAQLEEAEGIFTEAIAVDPKFALAYAGLCQSYTIEFDRTRNTELAGKAEAACQQALALDASLLDVEVALANVYLSSGRNERAAAIFNGAIRRDSSNADAYIGLARAYEGQQRAGEAEATYRKALEVEPDYWAAHSAFGRFLFQHGRADAAAVQYRRVTQLTPGSPLGFNNLGAALQMSGDFAGAARAFEQSLALEPTRSAYSNTGTMYYFLGQFAAAADLFRKAAVLANDDHRVWGNLADALDQMPAGHAEAQQTYRRAIALAARELGVNPKDAVDWAQLGYYYARVGDQTRARQDISRALELGADEVYVHFYHALVAVAGGDSNGALQALRRAVDLGFPRQLVRAAPEFAALRGDVRFRELVGTNPDPHG